MTDRWVCPVQLTPHPGPFAAGSTPQLTGALPESPKHDIQEWRVSVVEWRYDFRSCFLLQPCALVI
jgi:hypothetical protein